MEWTVAGYIEVAEIFSKLQVAAKFPADQDWYAEDSDTFDPDGCKKVAEVLRAGAEELTRRGVELREGGLDNFELDLQGALQFLDSEGEVGIHGKMAGESTEYWQHFMRLASCFTRTELAVARMACGINPLP